MALRDKINEAMDDEIVVDFSAARDGDFSAIKPGEYEAEVVECSSGNSKAGAPKVVFKLKITEEGDAKGRTFFKHAPVTGEGSGIFRETAKALGFEVEGMTKFKPADAVGKKALITIRFQKDSDELQEISKVKPLGKSSGRLRK